MRARSFQIVRADSRHGWKRKNRCIMNNNTCVGSVLFCLDGGLFVDHGESVACCVFGFPSCRWKEDVAELTRLVRHPNYKVPLSKLISISCKYLKRNGFDLLVSYSDLTQGHIGTVYKASGWKLNKTTSSRMVGLNVNGIYFPGRTCNANWKTRSPSKLQQLYPLWSIEPVFDIGKNMFFKCLGSRGEAKAERLGISEQRNGGGKTNEQCDGTCAANHDGVEPHGGESRVAQRPQHDER